MTYGPNDCHVCGEDCGGGMVGFDTHCSGATLLVCLSCKVARDGAPKLNHPNLAMRVLRDLGPRNEG